MSQVVVGQFEAGREVEVGEAVLMERGRSFGRENAAPSG
jgi:hypothetical protein